MTAFKNETPERPEIPRIITKRPERNGPTISTLPDDIRIYSNANRSIRYQHLPDREPGVTDEEIETKLAERFELLAELTVDAIEGRARSLILSGPGGVGKSFLVDGALAKHDPDGTKHTSHSGFSTPVGLLKMLYHHRNENNLLKLDDIDSVFNDEKSLNLIKTACDTTRNRVITYATNATLEDPETGEVIPTTFPFDGTIIFSTNIDFDQMIDRGSKMSRHFEALMTRSLYADLRMRTKRDYLVRVFMVADDSKLFENVPGGPLTREEEDDVLEFIDKNYRILRECSLRMAIKLGALRKGAKDEDKFTWDRKALLTCCMGVR